MKSSRVYLILLLFTGFLLLGTTSSCSRGSGCDNLKGKEVKLKKDGMPRSKPRTALFGKTKKRKGK